MPTNIRQFSFSQPNVTAQIAEQDNVYLWLAFAQEDGVCNLRKVSAFDLSQTFFSIDKEVDSIFKLAEDGTNLYTACVSDTILGEVISLSNPLTSVTEIPIPVGILESPVDVRIGDYLYYLTPGIEIGEPAKIIRLSTTGTFQQIIELTNSSAEVIDAASFEIDETTGDLWVVTNTNPVQYVRVFDTGGFVYDFEVFEATP